MRRVVEDALAFKYLLGCLVNFEYTALLERRYMFHAPRSRSLRVRNSWLEKSAQLTTTQSFKSFATNLNSLVYILESAVLVRSTCDPYGGHSRHSSVRSTRV
jgi:hypothetical protein